MASGRAARCSCKGPGSRAFRNKDGKCAFRPRRPIALRFPAINTYCTKTYGKDFGEITEAQRDEVLNGLGTGTVSTGPLPPGLFLDLLYQNVMEGFFSDPAYGGNRGKAAWKMIGYTGAIGNFVDQIESYHNKPFTDEPQSIGDLS